MLENLAAGRRADYHCRTQSDHGGLACTLTSLHRRNWLDRDGITETGLALVKAAKTA